MYKLSIAENNIKDYEHQIKSKSFKLKEVELTENKLKEVVGSVIHSWRVFQDGKRGGSNINFITAVILDFDKDTKIDSFKESKLFSRYKYVLYTSRNHNIDKFDGAGRQERFHVAFPFNAYMKDFNQYIGLQEGIIEAAIAEGLNPDVQVKDLARIFFPSRSNKLKKPLEDFYFYVNEGKNIEEDINTLTKVIDRNNNNAVRKITLKLDNEKLKLACKFLQDYNAHNGLEYSQWIRIGSSLHEVTEGEALFANISMNYKGVLASEKEIANKWNSTGKLEGVTLGTLFHIAYNLGWEYKPERTLNNTTALVLDSVKELEENFNKSLSADICKIVLSGAKFKLVVGSEREDDYYLTTSDIPQDVLYLNVSKKDKNAYKKELLRVFMSNGYLAREPYINKIAGLTKNSFKSKASLEAFINSKGFEMKGFDALTGKLTVIQSVIGESTTEFKDAELIEKVIQRIFNHKDYDYTLLIKKFLAQLVFEHRTTAKASLVLMGARGTGKSFFTNYIAGGFYKGSTWSYFGGGFSDWKEATKIVDVSESSEHKVNLKKLYNDIKDYSGAEQTLVNKKNITPYFIPATAYFVISMNDVHGFHIQDKGGDNEQFIVVNFAQEQRITETDEWHTWNVTTERVRNGLKTYALKYLLPIYLEMVSKESGFRYGFNTKGNSTAYQELLDNSMSFNDEGYLAVFEQLAEYFEGVGLEGAAYATGEDASFIQLHVLQAKKNNFLTIFLINAILKHKRLNLKRARLMSYFKDLGLEVKTSVRKINGKSFKGYFFKGLSSFIMENFLKVDKDFKNIDMSKDDDIPF